MSTYKMIKTHRGVRAGDVHSVVFHEGKTYEIDDDLAGQFETLEIIEPSKDEVSEALVEDDGVNIHENWLDTDPAVMRHGELTPKEIVQKDESPLTDAEPVEDEESEDGDEKPEGEKKAKKARKSAPENKTE